MLTRQLEFKNRMTRCIGALMDGECKTTVAGRENVKVSALVNWLRNHGLMHLVCNHTNPAKYCNEMKKKESVHAGNP